MLESILKYLKVICKYLQHVPKQWLCQKVSSFFFHQATVIAWIQLFEPKDSVLHKDMVKQCKAVA